MEQDLTPIVETPTAPDLGVSHGQVVVSDGVEEVIVVEKDEDGNVVGWHKEPANG